MLGKIRIDVYDIVGKRLGKLKVVGYHGNCYEETRGGPKLRHFYMVKCECGRIKVVRRSQILNNKIHSCGCERWKCSGNKNEK